MDFLFFFINENCEFRLTIKMTRFKDFGYSFLGKILKIIKYFILTVQQMKHSHLCFKKRYNLNFTSVLFKIEKLKLERQMGIFWFELTDIFNFYPKSLFYF